MSRWLEAAAPCQLSSNVGSIPAGRHTFAASASSVPADQLPLPESSLLKDDLEDARRAEADDLPAEHEGLAAAAALPGQQFVQTDAVASLPMGQALRQQASVQGRTWAFETGKLARLAAGSCLVRVADTSVLAAATCQPPPWSRRDAQQLQFEVRGRVAWGELGGQPEVEGGVHQSCTFNTRLSGGGPTPAADSSLGGAQHRGPALTCRLRQAPVLPPSRLVIALSCPPHAGGVPREAVRCGPHPLHLQQARGGGQGARGAGGAAH